MLLIFDLDGTIIDTKEEIEYTFRRAFQNLGLPFDERKMEKYIGLAVEELIECLLGYYDPEVEKEIKRVYLGLKERKIRVFPGMEDVLKCNGFRKAIYTSKRRDVAIRDLEYVGLANFFSVIVGADDVRKKKPHGEGVKKVIELTGENKEDAFVIGDTEMDILAAKNAGVKSIAVTWGFRSEDFLRAFEPDFIVQHPKDILNILSDRKSFFRWL